MVAEHNVLFEFKMKKKLFFLSVLGVVYALTVFNSLTQNNPFLLLLLLFVAIFLSGCVNYLQPSRFLCVFFSLLLLLLKSQLQLRVFNLCVYCCQFSLLHISGTVISHIFRCCCSPFSYSFIIYNYRKKSHKNLGFNIHTVELLCNSFLSHHSKPLFLKYNFCFLF